MNKDTNLSNINQTNITNNWIDKLKSIGNNISNSIRSIFCELDDAIHNVDELEDDNTNIINYSEYMKISHYINMKDEEKQALIGLDKVVHKIINTELDVDILDNNGYDKVFPTSEKNLFISWNIKRINGEVLVKHGFYKN